MNRGRRARSLRIALSRLTSAAIYPGVPSDEKTGTGFHRLLWDRLLFNKYGGGRLRARAAERQQSGICIRRRCRERGRREHDLLESRRHDAAARTPGRAGAECDLRLGALHEPRDNVARRPGLPDHWRRGRQSRRPQLGPQPLLRDRRAPGLEGRHRHQFSLRP